MPKRCIPCLGANIKAILRQEIGTRELALLLNTVADCQDENGLEVCGSRKGKRAPSQYNLFMASCIKGRPKGTPVQEQMKSCAAQYRQRKG